MTDYEDMSQEELKEKIEELKKKKEKLEEEKKQVKSKKSSLEQEEKLISDILNSEKGGEAR